jgi:hypothetical protein
MNYESKKTLFKYILKKDYEIKKYDKCNNILFINFDTFKIKCKYFLLFNIIENKLFWAWENPYCSLDVSKICYEIYQKNNEEFKNINKLKNEEFKTKIKELVKNTIKNFEKVELKNKIYNLQWIIEDKKKNYSSFYAITEIIYF